MLKGKKGKNLVSRMPQDRILLETDGPFTSMKQQPLYPWDANNMCIPELSEIWGLDSSEVDSILAINKETLLSERYSLKV